MSRDVVLNHTAHFTKGTWSSENAISISSNESKQLSKTVIYFIDSNSVKAGVINIPEVKYIYFISIDLIPSER